MSRVDLSALAFALLLGAGSWLALGPRACGWALIALAALTMVRRLRGPRG